MHQRPVATRCIIPNKLQLVWNDASRRHRSLMHWRQSIIGFPMHKRPVANRCIIQNKLQLVWNDASGHHRPECHPSYIYLLYLFPNLIALIISRVKSRVRIGRWRSDALLQCRYSDIGAMHRHATGSQTSIFPLRCFRFR